MPVPVAGGSDPHCDGSDPAADPVETGHDQDTRVPVNISLCGLRYLPGRD